MSQETLADLLGVTFQQVQKYEKGVNRMAVTRLIDASVALATPIMYFFEGLVGKTTKAQVAILQEGMAVTPEERKLLRVLRSTSPDVRRKVVAVIEALAPNDE